MHKIFIFEYVYHRDSLIWGACMELKKHICTQLAEHKKEFIQLTLDDDYIVRDNKPDVVRVIYSKGNAVLEDIKIGNQVVWLTGKLYFSTLYQSDDENHRLERIQGEIPFQEKLVMDTEEDSENFNVVMQIEDLSIGIMNCRKLVIRAVLNVEVACLEEENKAFCCGIAEEGYEQKIAEKTMLCLVEHKNETLQLQKEVMLPNARSNIKEVIFYQVDFANEEIRLLENRISYQTDAKIWVLYQSESTGEYECFETVVPFSGEIETYGMSGDEIFWAEVSVCETVVEPRGDYDGEARMLGVELNLSIKMQIYREESCEVLKDAYSLEKELNLIREKTTYQQLLVKNMSKVRLMEQQQLEQRQEKILQICGSSGTVNVDFVEKRENGIQIEGVLNVHILYTTTEDAMPFAHTEGQIPFEQFVEIPNFSQDTKIQMKYHIEQMQVNLLDSTEYEIKAVIEIDVLAVEEYSIFNITEIVEEALDMDKMQRQAGMIGYVKKEGEDLWDIAKKYHATASNILEIGNRVLVVKEVH